MSGGRLEVWHFRWIAVIVHASLGTRPCMHGAISHASRLPPDIILRRSFTRPSTALAVIEDLGTRLWFWFYLLTYPHSQALLTYCKLVSFPGSSLPPDFNDYSMQSEYCTQQTIKILAGLGTRLLQCEENLETRHPLTLLPVKPLLCCEKSFNLCFLGWVQIL